MPTVVDEAEARTDAVMAELDTLSDSQLDRQVAPDTAVVAAAMLTALIAAALARDEAELDALLTSLGQLARDWALQIKFRGGMLH